MSLPDDFIEHLQEFYRKTANVEDHGDGTVSFNTCFGRARMKKTDLEKFRVPSPSEGWDLWEEV